MRLARARKPRVITYWGVVRVIAGLFSVGALSQAVVDIVAGRICQAGFSAAVAVLIRSLTSILDDVLIQRVRHALRESGRRTLLSAIRIPPGLARTAPAVRSDDIDTASDLPVVDIAKSSAITASLLLVVLVGPGTGPLGALIVVGLGILSVPFYVRAGRRAQSAAIEYRNRIGALESAQLDALRRATEMRGLGATAGVVAKVQALSDRSHDVATSAVRAALGSSLITEFLGGVAVGLVAMIAGFRLLRGETTLGCAVFAVLVTAEIVSHIRRYGNEFHRREAVELAQQRLAINVPRPPLVGSIAAVELVTAARDEPINFVVNPGERLRIRGPSGSGKTTLVATLLGWIDPVDGFSRRPVHVGYVSPTSGLPESDVRSAVALKGDASDVEIDSMLTDLGLARERFGNLNVTVDSRNVSDGERVRLLIARSLLCGAEALILDDIAGILDDDAREAVIRTIASRHDLAILECTSGDTLVPHARELELT